MCRSFHLLERRRILGQSCQVLRRRIICTNDMASFCIACDNDTHFGMIYSDMMMDHLDHDTPS